MDYSDIRQATNALLFVCDGAQSTDGQGFNRLDSAFVRDLMSRSEWTSKQASVLYKILYKYRVQLDNYGIDFNDIKEPIAKDSTKIKIENIKNVRIEKDRIFVYFKANKEEFFSILNKIKTLPGREFHAGSKEWSVPETPYNIKELSALGFSVSASAPKPVSTSAPIEIPKGLALYPFQIEGVQHLERLGGRALLADEMGLGKTIQVIAYMRQHPEMRPALIIVPASLKINWQRELKKWLPDEEVAVVNGRTSGQVLRNITIINYDILMDYLQSYSDYDIKLMVLDESHNIKNMKTKRCKAVQVLGKNIENIICVTGTPITNRPAEFFTTLHLLDKQSFPNYYRYAQEFCAPTHNGFGWEFKGASNTEKLHDILIQSFMIRRLKKDVLKDLPPKQRSIIPMEIDNRTEYNRAEKDFISYLLENEGRESALKAQSAETLVKMERLKQLAVAGKREQLIEWIENFIEAEKLVVFCVHHSIVDCLLEKFKDVAVKVDGRDSITARQKAVDDFQNNSAIKLFIGNIQAAGTGITLTASTNVAFVELPWVPAFCDQAEDRCHRIGTVGTVNAYYLVGLNTIEESMANLIDSKRQVIEAVMDGTTPDDDSLVSKLIEKYKEG